jgi:ankyrin repeat protein
MTRLLDQGGDPNAIIEHRYGDERHALIQYAAGGGDIATIPVLLQRGARTSAAPERLEDPFLVVLVRHERASPEVISAYVQQGHDINARTSAGRTALHELAYQPWCDRVASTLHTLLRAGADIDARDADGHTPLMECVRAYCTRPDKNPDKIAAWLAAQASVNAIDAKGKSVLHHFFGACINRGINGTDHSDHHYQAALELLLSRGADMDATTSTGLYPEESGDPKTVPDLRDALRRLRGRRTLAEAARPDDLAGTTESQPPQNAATGQQQRSMAMGRHPRKLSH